jgi:hypothetical protein
MQQDDVGISKKIGLLSEAICSIYLKDATKVAKSSKAAVIRHMDKYENIQNPTPEQIIRFLNRNKNHMLCGNTNYMVESFRHGAYDELFNIFFYEELLVEDEGLYVDINAISYTGGVTENEPETVLDYMYREVKRESRSKKSRREIQRLIEMFEEYFNGKRFGELTDEEQAAALERKPN